MVIKFFSNILKNDYGISFIKKISLILIGVINSALIKRYLGVELSGQYAYILNMVNLASIFFNFGIYQCFAIYSRKFPSEIESIKQKFVNFYFLQFIVYFMIAIIISFSFDSIENSVSVFLVPLNVLTGQLGFMMLIDNLKFRSFIYICNATLKLILTILIYLYFPTQLIYLIILILIYDLFFILIYIIKLKVKPKLLNLDIKFIWDLIKLGFFPMLTMLLVTMNYKVDIIILKHMVSLEHVGLYSTGIMLAEYAWMIPDVFKEVVFSRTAKNDSISSITFSLRISFLCIILIIAGVAMFGKQIINILFGVEFIPAYEVTVLLFAGIPSMMFYKIIGPLYIAQGNQKFNFYTLLISVCLNILLNLLLIPKFEIKGAAFASVISYSVCGIIFMISFLRKYNLSVFDILFLKSGDVKNIMKMFR